MHGWAGSSRTAAARRPRDTHGDLRLEHVYWFPDRDPPGDWIAVDCIEFDDRFRYADPIADIAFLAMELSLEGRGDLAQAFVEAYMAATGDDDGRPLLPFYRSYRAAVRGKVDGMKLAETEVPAADRAVARVAPRPVAIRARGARGRGRKPAVVLVGGLPGAGKSSLARNLADQANFTVIRSDQIRKELAGRTAQDAPAPFGEGLYTADWNARTYAECLHRAEQVVFLGQRALIDAMFYEESRRRVLLDAARRWGVTGCLILCKAEPDVIRDRLAGRQGDASDAGLAIYAEIAQRWEPLSPATRDVTRLIDTGASLALRPRRRLMRSGNSGFGTGPYRRSLILFRRYQGCQNFIHNAFEPPLGSFAERVAGLAFVCLDGINRDPARQSPSAWAIWSAAFSPRPCVLQSVTSASSRHGHSKRPTRPGQPAGADASITITSSWPSSARSRSMPSCTRTAARTPARVSRSTAAHPIRSSPKGLPRPTNMMSRRGVIIPRPRGT